MCASFTAHKYEWILFLCFAAFHISIANLYMAPVSYPDEYGVLAVANWLFGGADWISYFNWGGTAAYYGYTSAPLIGWVFLFFEDIQSIYFAILIVKSIMVSIIPVICYKLLHEVLMVESIRDKILFSVAVSLYPALTMYSKRACNETMLHLSMFACFYLIGKCAACEEPKRLRIYSAFLAFFAVIAYATHGMGLAFIVAVFLVIAFVHIFLKRKIINYTFFAFSFAIFFFIDSRIKAFLKDTVFQASEDELLNTFAYSFNRLVDNSLNMEGLSTFLTAVFSRLHYVSVSTFGLFPLFVCILMGFLFLFLKRYCSKQSFHFLATTPLERAELALVLFGLFIIACGIGLSSLHHMSEIPRQHGIFYMYGRYHEYMVLPLILFGFYYVFTKDVPAKRILISAVVSAASFFALSRFMQQFVLPNLFSVDASLRRSHIYGVLPFTGHSVSELLDLGVFRFTQYNLLTLGLTFIMGLIIFTILLIKKNYAVSFVLIAFFMYGTASNLYTTGLELSRVNYNRHFVPLQRNLDDFRTVSDVYDAFPTLYFMGTGGLAWTYRVQLTFNRYSIAGYMRLRDFERVRNPEEMFNNAIIVANSDFELENIDPAFYRIMGTRRTSIWIRGDEIRAFWAERDGT